MNAFSRPLRKEIDRFALPYVHAVIDEVKAVRQSLAHEARAMRAALVDETRGLYEKVTASVADEARGVRESVTASVTDETAAIRVSVADEARGVRESVTASVADEARGVREALTASLGDEARAVREEVGALRSDLDHLGSEVGLLRRDMVEMTRMLRMQGDASDQVAEVMGRTLARLSAEVEALAGALDRSGLAFEASAD